MEMGFLYWEVLQTSVVKLRKLGWNGQPAHMYDGGRRV